MRKQHICLGALFALALCYTQYGTAQNTTPYWSTAGNSNATSSSKLGTTNAVPLRILTKNTEQMRIDTLGRVGIGTTSPADQLHIISPLGKHALRAQVNGSTKLLVHSGGGVVIGSSTAPPANGLYVYGSVGIGTATPASGYKLHVAGKSRFSTGLVVPNGDVQVTSNTAPYAMTLKSANGGIYAAAFLGDIELSTGIGVHGLGHIGVKGTGTIGIQGYGDEPGGAGTGVYGHASRAGKGVIGESEEGTGILGIGYSAGVIGRGEYYGVQGYATDEEGFGGTFSSEYGSGLYARAGSGQSSFAGEFAGNVYASGVFQSSDRNLKQNVQEFDGALSIIGKLKPRNYEFKTDTKLVALHLPKGVHYGLIAQDVEEVLPNLVTDVRHSLNPPKPRDSVTRTEPGKARDVSEQRVKREQPPREMLTTKAVNYTELIPIMVKSIQELDEKTQRIAELEKKNQELESRLQKLETLLTTGSPVTLTSAYLKQNSPNPAGGTTIIGYHVPTTIVSARLDLTNTKGQVIRTIRISNRGTGQLNLTTTMLAAGTYNYTLYVDGKQADTKRLIIAQ